MNTEQQFKPMLASTIEDFDKLTMALHASAKLDGYRCLIKDNQAVSRNLKPIRNTYVREQIEANMDILNGFDGELCLKDLTAPFNEVSSAISREDGTPDFRYVIFDKHDSEGSYQERFLNNINKPFPDFVVVVPMKTVNSIEELTEAHINWTSQGFEGTMIRRADGKDFYKAGRSTNREIYLCKIKDFADDEAVILDFVERQHNGNEATKDNLGHTKRSSHLENMVGRDDLGAIVVKSDKFSESFNIGSGFDDALRSEIWNNRNKYIGKLVTFTHQPSGAKAEGKPRFPVFKAFRESWDMS